jgi:hypothetical protein
VTSRAPLSTRSLSAECMAQCASLDFLLCVFAFPATNFTWTYSAVTGNCPWSVSQFEEALTLAGESLPTTTECEACALIRPERAQSKLPQIHGFVRTRSRCRHRNSFNFAARLVCGGRTVHPSRGYLERVSPRVIDHMLHRDRQQKRNIMSVLGKLRSGSAIEIRTLRNCCTTKTEGDPASPESGRVYASAGIGARKL